MNGRVVAQSVFVGHSIIVLIAIDDDEKQHDEEGSCMPHELCQWLLRQRCKLV